MILAKPPTFGGLDFVCPEEKGDVVITAYSKGKWGSGYCVLERKMVVVVIAYRFWVIEIGI